jgi:hypothetical protein
MTQVILDYCLSMNDAQPTSVIQQVLGSFTSLIQNERLELVKFLSPEEFRELERTFFPRLLFNKQKLFWLISDAVQWVGGLCEATPLNGPTDLSTPWKRGLRDAIADPEDWRNPQIIFPAIRRAAWPAAAGGSEVQIRLEACVESETTSVGGRLLVELERYADDHCARADSDPWDLRRANPGKNPCMLPKPAHLRHVNLADLRTFLPEAEWQIGDNRYYLPPERWDPFSCTKEEWRRGHAFPRGYKNGNYGWLDREGRVWCWDRSHVYSHWDVQLDDGEYIRVTYDGKYLE